jgi:hypothetical protein
MLLLLLLRMPSRAPARLSGEANRPSGARPRKCIIIIGCSSKPVKASPITHLVCSLLVLSHDEFSDNSRQSALDLCVEWFDGIMGSALSTVPRTKAGLQ